MSTKFGTAILKGDDSYQTGRQVAKNALAKIGDKKVDFSVVFVSSKYDYAQVIKGIREETGNAPLIGCSTAGEFTEEKVEKDSVACALISSDTHKFFTGMGKGIRKNEIDCLKDAVAKLPQQKSMKDYPVNSFIVLLDGLSGKGEEVSLAAISLLGSNIRIAGGSAGDDLKFKETSTFSNDTASSDSISVASIFSKTGPTIGIDHGHTPVSIPYTVTKAIGNKIYELDGKPAMKVWLDATREPAKQIGIDVDKLWQQPDQIGKFSFIFEGGLKTGKGYKIRWSGLGPDTKDHLPFVCSIPEGAVMRVMTGTKESQIASARNAARYALENLNGKKPAGAIVFDCVVRGAILGNEFSTAIDEIKKVLGNIPIVGFETYGEIGLEEGQLSGFHNTTTVVLLFPE